MREGKDCKDCCRKEKIELYSLANPPKNGWGLRHIRKISPLPGKSNNVFLAEVKSSKELFVLKKLKKLDKYPPSSSALVEKEIHLIVDHPNVIRTFGAIEMKTTLYLMIEYAKCGDLFKFASNHCDETLVSRWLRDVVLGLKYLHEMGIIHRDIKAENVVITESGSCKIIDFGFAAKLPLQSGMLNDGTRAGTIDYLSPELLWGNDYDHSIDIWSVGVLAYVLLCGHFPFVPHIPYNTDSRKTALFKAILDVDFAKGHAFKKLSKEAKDFVCRTLVQLPDKRLSLDEMLCHPFTSPVRKLCLSSSSSLSSYLTSSSSSTEQLEIFEICEKGETESSREKKTKTVQ